jgi:hypothetical protein
MRTGRTEWPDSGIQKSPSVRSLIPEVAAAVIDFIFAGFQSHSLSRINIIIHFPAT